MRRKIWQKRYNKGGWRTKIGEKVCNMVERSYERAEKGPEEVEM